MRLIKTLLSGVAALGLSTGAAFAGGDSMSQDSMSQESMAQESFQYWVGVSWVIRRSGLSSENLP